MSNQMQNTHSTLRIFYKTFLIFMFCHIPSTFATSPINKNYIEVIPCKEERGVAVEVPVVFSYESLRKAVKWEDPKPIHINGKIVVYKDYLLINEPNEGIHIYDNSDPKKPTALGFIAVPGNSDLMIRNDIIYADSFIDLVLIDFSNIESVKEIGRSLNIYQPNPYRFERIDLNSFNIDSNEEIVVGKKLVCVNY